MSKQRGGHRIPLALQNIFLASNRGETVDKPPAGGLANALFRGLVAIIRRKNLPGKEPDVTETDQTFSADDSGPDSDSVTPLRGRTKSTTPPIARSPSKRTTKRPVKLTPQSYLEAVMKSRGYSVARFDALKTGYHSKPTEAQMASYDVHVLNIIKTGDLAGLEELLQAGISTNPCNAFGDSLVHTICRISKYPKLLAAMIRAGADLQVSDDYGKTVLHDACWAAVPNFAIVAMVLDYDVHLLRIRDARGSLPLSYVPHQQAEAWIEFLQANKDRFWPEDHQGEPPSRALEAPDTHVVPDPPLPLNVVRMLASGRMSAREVAFLMEDGSSTEDSDDDFSMDDDEDYDDDSTLCSDDSNAQHVGITEDYRHPSGSDDEDSVVEGFEDELTQDSGLEGYLGIRTPQYTETSFGAPSSSREEKPGVPPVFEVKCESTPFIEEFTPSKVQL